MSHGCQISHIDLPYRSPISILDHILSICPSAQAYDKYVEDGVDPVKRRGRAAQADPVKPALKPPGTERLKLKCDDPLSSFGFKFNLRRCAEFSVLRTHLSSRVSGRGLHSSALQLTLCRS